MGQFDRFPVSDYYKGNVIEAVTISNTGTWWTAAMVLQDPKTRSPFLSLYRWQNRNGEWKTSAKFKIRTAKQLSQIMTALSELKGLLEP